MKQIKILLCNVLFDFYKQYIFFLVEYSCLFLNVLIMKNIEMHCHTTGSDGKNAPEEVIMEARRKNLDFLALTDHDVISSPDFQGQLLDA